MTIDECLEMAGRYLKLADNQGAMTYKRAQYAAIAQACAQTAQAMILDAACSKGQAVNDKPAYWLRVDAGN